MLAVVPPARVRVTTQRGVAALRGRRGWSRGSSCRRGTRSSTTRRSTGTAFVRITIPLPGPCRSPTTASSSRARARSLVMSRPLRVWAPTTSHRHFGVFAPLYIVCELSATRRPADLTDLGDVFDGQQARRQRRRTLRLLVLVTRRAVRGEPYVPCSRLAWNELFLDLSAIPELSQSAGPASVESHDTKRARDHSARRARRAPGRDPPARRLFTPLRHEDLRGRSTARRARGVRSGAARARRLREVSARRRRSSACCGSVADRREGRRAARCGFSIPAALRSTTFSRSSLPRALGALADSGPRPAASGSTSISRSACTASGFDPCDIATSSCTASRPVAPPDLLFAGGQNWRFPRSPPTRSSAATQENDRDDPQHLRYAKVLRIDVRDGPAPSVRDSAGLRRPTASISRIAPSSFYAILAIESQRSGTLWSARISARLPPSAHRDSASRCDGMHVVEYAARADGLALEPAPPARSVR